MAKSSSSGIIGDFILLIVIVFLVILFLDWLKKSEQSSSSGKSGVSLGGGSGSGAAGAMSSINNALMNAWTNLAKAVGFGQALSDQLSTTDPGTNALIPTASTSMNDSWLNDLASPFDIGSSLYDLGGANLEDDLTTSDPSSSDFLDMQPLDTFDMSGIGFTPDYGD